MKQFSLFLCCLIISIGCGLSKPPRKPGKSGNSGAADAAANNGSVEKPLGSDITAGKTADDYLGLRCDAPDTFRGIRAWRRLSNAELINTVQDVFGLSDGVDFSAFINDIPKKENFDTVAVSTNYIYGARFKGYMQFAESLSSKVDIKKIFPCLSEGVNCINRSLPNLLALAWRRPAAPDEITKLASLYSAMASDGLAAEAAARSLIEAIVLSHNFLYRSELGQLQADGSFLLDDWELASALSYTLWRRPPNAQLRAMAQKGELSRPEVLRSQAENMIDDPQARRAWSEFAGMWLDASKIEKTNKNQPEFNDTVKKQLSKEVKDFFVHTMFDAPEKSYDQLLNSTYTIADPSVAWLYESTPDVNGQLPYTQQQRRGLLGQAGFLASHSLPDQPNPISRGVFVAERLLCLNFAPAPAVEVPQPKPGISNKELFKQHTQGSCASCHATIDSLGFALEHFDALGKFRNLDAGLPIVVDSQVPLDGKTVTVNSPQALSASIAASKQGMECFVRENFRYALGRTEYHPRPIVGPANPPTTSPQSELDRCQIQSITQAMQQNNGDLRTAVLELITSPAFRQRLVGQVKE